MPTTQSPSKSPDDASKRTCPECGNYIGKSISSHCYDCNSIRKTLRRSTKDALIKLGF